MDPSKQFEWCLGMLRVLFRLTGQDIFSGNSVHPSIVFYVNFWSFVCMISACIYTVLSFDPLTAFKGLIFLFGTAQVFIKFLCIPDLQVLIEIAEFIKSVFQSNSQRTARDNDLCVKYSNWNRMIINFITVSYIVLGLCYSLPSLVQLAFTGEFTPPYGMYLPGFNTERWTHCSILFLFNFAALFIDISILTAFDGFIFITFNNMFMMSKVITNEIDELGKMLIDKSISEKEINSKLIAVIKMHVDYNAKIKLLDQGFYKACFFQISTASLFTSTCIFLIFSTELVEPYAVIILGSAQILLFCILGTIIEVSSTRIANAVKSFDWHLLPQDQRKMYLLFLHYAQQPQVLYIAKITPLNMDTSVNIFKSIYSYSAFLRSMEY